jgi:beta-lactamase superfamily II metal-dependent hydrolase
MDTLRVRVYNVRFGDAILVSVPEMMGDGQHETRHILIDVGNVLSGPGGEDAVFGPVVRNVLEVLDGRPLDLYVMTHEHMDHTQGLLYASERLALTLPVRYAWLPASGAEDYYDRHPRAKKQLDLARTTMTSIARFLEMTPAALSPTLQAVLLNNDWRATTKCVAYLRALADQTAYVYRGCDLRGKHPFQEARLDIWAPEEDTSEYYGPMLPMALGVASGREGARSPMSAVPTPPPGVDAGAFYNLVEIRRRGYTDNLFAIDRAANNTSIVFCLEWRGWRLLFPGDAEQRSWKTMHARGLLRPVHFLKVGHHGSHNGTPPLQLLDQLLPLVAPDGRRRCAVLSTCLNVYHNVPHEHTLGELRRRCALQSSAGLADGAFIDVTFEG